MLKRSVQCLFLLPAFLPWLWWRVTSCFSGPERAFQGVSQFCALFPGRSGALLRAAFYRLSLPGSSQDTALGFLTTFSDPRATLGRNISTGVCCNIGYAHIGNDCILASMVCVTSGKRQHFFDDTATPIRLQKGEKNPVHIGQNCWIGAGAVILADVGEGSVVAAGSVVADSIPPYSVAAGVPAKVIKQRARPTNEDTPAMPPESSCLPHVMQLIVALRMSGAERLALDLLRKGRGRLNGSIVGMYLEPGSLQVMAEREGVASEALRYEGKFRPFCAVRLARLLRSQGVSLLHVHAEYLLPVALPAAILARVPLVLSVHSQKTMETMLKLRLFVRATLPFIRSLVCVNEPLRDYYVHTLGCRPARVRVIHNGVDTSCFTLEGPVADLPWKEDGLFIFGNVARLHGAKDLASLLLAFDRVFKKHPNSRLIFVGEGDERAMLEALIKERGLEQAVWLTGEREDIPALMRSFDLFVLSSLHEGMPMALLEAMACGCPALCTDVGGIARLNKGNTDGGRVALVPPKNTGALAEAMEALLENAPLRAALAKRGSDHVRLEYGCESMAEKYYALYRDLGLPIAPPEQEK